METQTARLRTEIIHKLQHGITHKGNYQTESQKLLQDLSHRLILVDNFTERKSIINAWYKELLSASTLRKHHLSYNHPSVNKELDHALTSLATKFKRRFQNYFG